MLSLMLRPIFILNRRCISTETANYPKLLRRILLNTIKAQGPLPIGDFMRLVSNHPKYGYYMYKEAFGHRGDFCTAPEFSQLFGEVLGISILHTLQTKLAHDSHRSIRLIELGPGNGSMMLDILRTFSGIDSIFRRTRQCLFLESSLRLQKVQEQNLRGKFPSIDFQWVRTIDDIAYESHDMTTICVSNEFFDSLPLFQFKRPSIIKKRRWAEVLVDGIDIGNDAEFRFCDSSGPTANSICLKVDERQSNEEGDWIELCPEAKRISDLIAVMLQKVGGIFLMVDYGRFSEIRRGSTLRAIQNHRILPFPLENIGEADLSADVDFNAISSSFSLKDFHKIEPVDQNVFLQTYGIKERLDRLLRLNAAPELIHVRGKLVSGAETLLDPLKMGSAYKVFMAITK